MSIPRPPAPIALVAALMLGVTCSALVACGSKTNPHLLSAARADRLGRDLDDIRAAVSNHDCQAARQAVQRLEDDITSLPADTDPRLRQRLEEGAANLRARAATECQQTQTTTTQTQTTTIPTQTETTTTPPTDTTTTPTDTTTTPTTTTPTTTTPTTTTTTPDSGGSTVPPG
jgi:cell division septation protein DedD